MGGKAACLKILANSYAILIGERNRNTVGTPRHGREDIVLYILRARSLMIWTGVWLLRIRLSGGLPEIPQQTIRCHKRGEICLVILQGLFFLHEVS